MARNICDFFRTFLVVLSILVLFGKEVVSDCYRTTIYEYKGHQHTTYDGLTCLRWDSFDHEFSDSERYTAATTSEDKNYCRDPGRDDYLWCYVNIDGQYRICDIEKCVTADVDKCGSLEIEQPTILGRNVTFTFGPETTSNADVKWQRRLGSSSWSTLPNDQKFTQYHRDRTYYLILTNTVKDNDEVFYRVEYKNNSVSCLMTTPRLELQDIDQSANLCGFLYRRTTKVKEGENVELEYYPTKYIMDNQERYDRKWMHSTQNQTTSITLMKGVYEEEKEPNDKYVLTIFLFKYQMKGRYVVNCGGTVGYSSIVHVILPVAPSAPVFEGLKDIDGCKGCIIGEDGYQFSVLCKISGGTQPIQVTMSIGNESLSSGRYNETAYMAYFTLRNKHHMTTMKCTVMNDALASPLITTAWVYVINAPVIEFNISDAVLNIPEGERAYVQCSVKSVRTFNISWVEISGEGTVYEKHCHMKTDCVIVIDAYLISQRHLNCKISSLETTDQKTLTVNIYEKAEVQSNNQDTPCDSDRCVSYIWIIISSCLAAALIGVSVGSLVIIKEMKTAKAHLEAQLEANQERHDASVGRTGNDVELEARAYERLNVRDASGQLETLYSELSP